MGSSIGSDALSDGTSRVPAIPHGSRDLSNSDRKEAAGPSVLYEHLTNYGEER